MRTLHTFLSTAVISALATRVGADKIFVTQPTDGTGAYAETDRRHNVTWTIPKDWSSGEYYVRAFGNATYRCSSRAGGMPCSLEIEDLQPFQIHTLQADKACPPLSNSIEVKSGDLPSSPRNSLLVGSDTLSETPTPSDDQGKQIDEKDKENVRRLVAGMKDYDLDAGTYTTTSGSVELLSNMEQSVVGLLRVSLVQSNPNELPATVLLDLLRQDPSLLIFPTSTFSTDTPKTLQSKEDDNVPLDASVAPNVPESTNTTTSDQPTSSTESQMGSTQLPVSRKDGPAGGELGRNLNQVQDKHPADISPACRTWTSAALTVAATLGSTVTIVLMTLNVA
ncbi:hypothetical protein BGZ73_005740 [Actinomortierella ambigua]|nr:hypothetical protein BGZ73_005740 [Actinomortierella ambigua]